MSEGSGNAGDAEAFMIENSGSVISLSNKMVEPCFVNRFKLDQAILASSVNHPKL